MRYRMREKIWTIRDRYVIRDPADVELFHIEGKLLSIGKKMTFADTDGRELARIEQKVMSWRPTFFVHREGAPSVRVRRMYLPLFKPRYVIEVPGEEPIEVRGNVWAHEYELVRGTNCLGTVSKKVFSWADSYGIDLDDEEDQVLLLAACVVVDVVCHTARRNNS
jgi:uncharacterized protein YxjI